MTRFIRNYERLLTLAIAKTVSTFLQDVSLEAPNSAPVYDPVTGTYSVSNTRTVLWEGKVSLRPVIDRPEKTPDDVGGVATALSTHIALLPSTAKSALSTPGVVLYDRTADSMTQNDLFTPVQAAQQILSTKITRWELRHEPQ